MEVKCGVMFVFTLICVWSYVRLYFHLCTLLCSSLLSFVYVVMFVFTLFCVRCYVRLYSNLCTVLCSSLLWCVYVAMFVFPLMGVRCYLCIYSHIWTVLCSSLLLCMYGVHVIFIFFLYIYLQASSKNNLLQNTAQVLWKWKQIMFQKL
jgi:hypothetical protein